MDTCIPAIIGEHGIICRASLEFVLNECLEFSFVIDPYNQFFIMRIFHLFSVCSFFKNHNPVFLTQKPKKKIEHSTNFPSQDTSCFVKDRRMMKNKDRNIVMYVLGLSFVILIHTPNRKELKI